GHDLAVSPVAVGVDPGGVHQDGRTLAGRHSFYGPDDRRRWRHPAGDQVRHPPACPAATADIGAGEVDDSLGTPQLNGPGTVTRLPVPVHVPDAVLSGRFPTRENNHLV